MAAGHDRWANLLTASAFRPRRRGVLHGALLLGRMATLSSLTALARPQTQNGGPRSESTSAVALARLLNRTRFSDLPPLAVAHVKMITPFIVHSPWRSGSPHGVRARHLASLLPCALTA